MNSKFSVKVKQSVPRDNLRTVDSNRLMNHNLSSNDHVHNGIVECRQRLRRCRATKNRNDRRDGGTQIANRESHSFGSNIDRHATSRTRCEVSGEADVK